MTTGRKHREQMKASEIAALEISVRKVTARILSTHAAARMAEKGVTVKEIENCLKYGIAIEIHNEAGELRVVIRHAYGRPKVAVCLVIGLTSQTVVTTWKNAGSDSHSTLNLFKYQWNVNVASLLAQGA
jgi:hypothetical protein